MEAYAVIETGGKQYRVLKGSVLDIELLDAKEGDKVKIDKVLAVSDGTKLSIGTPMVAGAAVTLEVVKLFRGDKVISFKKKRRKGYHKKIGHRQELMKVRVESLGA